MNLEHVPPGRSGRHGRSRYLNLKRKKEKSIMSLLVKMTLSAALVLSIGVPFGAFAAGEKRQRDVIKQLLV